MFGLCFCSRGRVEAARLGEQHALSEDGLLHLQKYTERMLPILVLAAVLRHAL